MFQLSDDVLLRKGGNSFMFEGQHAIREQGFVCEFSKFLQVERDSDVDHVLVLFLQICGFNLPYSPISSFACLSNKNWKA